MFRTLGEKLRSCGMMWYLTIPASEFILTIGNFFVLYFGGNMILDHTMT